MSPIIYPLLGAASVEYIGNFIRTFCFKRELSADGAFAISCTLMYNALFYFLPIYVGYSAIKSFKYF